MVYVNNFSITKSNYEAEILQTVHIAKKNPTKILTKISSLLTGIMDTNSDIDGVHHNTSYPLIHTCANIIKWYIPYVSALVITTVDIRCSVCRSIISQGLESVGLEAAHLPNDNVGTSAPSTANVEVYESNVVLN